MTLLFVLSDVRTESVYAIQISVRILILEARFQSLAIQCEIRVGQSGTGTGFSASISGFLRQYHSTCASYWYSF